MCISLTGRGFGVNLESFKCQGASKYKKVTRYADGCKEEIWFGMNLGSVDVLECRRDSRHKMIAWRAEERKEKE